MSEYIDKDKLLKYLEDTVLFSGKTDSPYLNGQVNGAKLVISRIKDYYDEVIILDKFLENLHSK